MSLIPTWPIAAGTLVIGLAVGAGGMYTRVAALKVTIAEMKATAAEGVSTQYKEFVDDLNTAAANVATAAKSGQADFAALGVKLDTLNRTYKNAKPPALAVDCRPGAVRVRNLAESAAAVDSAIARPVVSK